MAPLERTLLSGYIGQGQKVEEFEKSLMRWIGCPRILTVNSCTSAIQLALRLANVGHGDEVLSTPMTCTATNMPILAMGAKIKWVDVNPFTGNMDWLDIERKITPKTKAIVMVHWGGLPCDIDEINEIAKKYGIKVIEDAAHAFGSEYKGGKIGNHSDFSCLSFQAIKHLTTVDGGALVCKDPSDHERGKLLRWYGINREGSRKDFRCEEDIKEYGYKFHMNDVAATIGLEQIKHVDRNILLHRVNSLDYDFHFNVHPQPDRRSSYWLYTIITDRKKKFMEHMAKRDIQVSSVHARNDLHAAFRESMADLPGTELFSSQHVCIPVGWWLSETDRRKIIRAVKDFGLLVRNTQL